MKKIIVLICIMAALPVFGQVVKPMGKGLDGTVHCACADSLGNVYAVTVESNGTYLNVNRWNISTEKWSVYATISGFINNWGINRMTCQFLNQKFYMTVPSGSRVQLMGFNGSKWDTAAIMQTTGYWFRLGSIVYKRKMYLYGDFDSIGGQSISNFAVFDGTSITTAGIPSSYLTQRGPISADILNDTLYFAINDKIVSHTAPNNWSTYYQFNNPLSSSTYKSLTVANNKIYAAIDGDSVHVFQNRKIVGGTTSDYRYTYQGVDNIAICTDFNGRLSLLNGLGGSMTRDPFLQNETYLDTNDVSFLRVNNQKLYYFGSHGVILEGVNYGNIVEFDVDSIKPVAIDTVVVKVFRDINKNYVWNTGDKPSQSYYTYENYYNQITDANGIGIQYPLDNENIGFRFTGEMIGDTCYKTPFPGTMRSKAFHSSISRDTVFIPLQRTSLKDVNFQVKMFGALSWRILDTAKLYVNIYNRDCNFNTGSATVKVTLQSDFVFLKSTPAYTSISGNVLTFNITNINPYSLSYKPQIVIEGIYPLTKFKIGDVVKHYVSIVPTVNEDTTDNYCEFNHVLAYSRDPNEKRCWPEGKITSSIKRINYVIHFQNEGNDVARRVTVVDTLNMKMPVYEFQMLGASHNCTISQRNNNIITWVFDDINLLPKSVNEEKSKGFISLDVGVRGDLREGDSIRNKAYIYFDYNEPIVTNYAVVRRVSKVDDDVFYKRSMFMSVYPNPANHQFSIDNLIGNKQSITIYNVAGQQVGQTDVAAFSQSVLDCSTWSPGLYIVVSSTGESVKIIIE
ncbi:MAG: T9SS type A sorting domain-containing protein [Bacteroidota bacterium]